MEKKIRAIFFFYRFHILCRFYQEPHHGNTNCADQVILCALMVSPLSDILFHLCHKLKRLSHDEPHSINEKAKAQRRKVTCARSQG